MIFSKTMKISSFVCDCTKTSSKQVIAFLLSISGLKILLVNGIFRPLIRIVEFVLLISNNELC